MDDASTAGAAGAGSSPRPSGRKGEANPRFVVTSLRRAECKAKHLYEKVYCARGEMENRIKECQLDLYVQSRVRELQAAQAQASQITAERLLAELEEARSLALSLGQAAPRCRSMGRAKLG